VSTLQPVYKPLYTFLHNLLNVLVQITNKMGLQKKLGVYATMHASLVAVYSENSGYVL
jgi:hypothetical protein